MLPFQIGRIARGCVVFHSNVDVSTIEQVVCCSTEPSRVAGELPCNFEKGSDGYLADDPPRHLHESGRARPDRYSTDYSGALRRQKIAGARAWNGSGSKGIPKSER